MINSESKLMVTFKESNPYLVSKGKYSTIQFKGKTVIKTDREAKYSYATRSLTMSNDFIINALTRPEKPHKKASNEEWNAFSRWNVTNDEQKIKFRLKQYAHDINSELVSFEII